MRNMLCDIVKAYDDIGIHRMTTNAELLEHSVEFITPAVAALIRVSNPCSFARNEVRMSLDQ